jgi:hypothetical protein
VSGCYRRWVCGCVRPRVCAAFQFTVVADPRQRRHGVLSELRQVAAARRMGLVYSRDGLTHVASALKTERTSRPPKDGTIIKDQVHRESFDPEKALAAAFPSLSLALSNSLCCNRIVSLMCSRMAVAHRLLLARLRLTARRTAARSFSAVRSAATRMSHVRRALRGLFASVTTFIMLALT